MAFTITEVRGMMKIYHKGLILELTRQEADDLITELQSFRKMLKWTAIIDYGIEANEVKE